VTDGLEIASTYTGDLILPAVTIVVGNITYSGPDLINFSAPVLSVVVGTFNFTGAFRSYVCLSYIDQSEMMVILTTGVGDSLSMPVITQITEALIVETSDSSFDCSPFQMLLRDEVVGGEFTCTV
jgi:hypothetical protein